MGNYYKKWTDEDKEYLADSWGVTSPIQIAKHLSRTPNAVIVQSKRMHLGSFTAQGTYFNKNQVAQMLGVDYKVIVRNFENKGMKFKPKSVRTKQGKQYVIKSEDLLKWLKSNQELYDSRRIELFALGTEPEWLKAKRKLDNSTVTKFRGTKFTPAEDARIIHYLKRDMTQRQIGEILNRSESSINARIQKLDIWGTGKLKEAAK